MDESDDYVADQRIERKPFQADPCSFELHLKCVIDLMEQNVYRFIRIHFESSKMRRLGHKKLRV